MVHYVNDVVCDQSTQSRGVVCVLIPHPTGKTPCTSLNYPIYFTTNLEYSIVDYKHRQNIEKL